MELNNVEKKPRGNPAIADAGIPRVLNSVSVNPSGRPSRTLTYSFTQISQYLRCPRSYRYRYLDGGKKTREQPWSSVAALKRR